MQKQQLAGALGLLCKESTPEGMQTLLDVVQEFTTWCGMEINVIKTFLLVTDKDRKRRESMPAPDLIINGERLKTLDINDACRYLDYWGTGNGDISATREVVREKAKVARDLTKSHPLTPKLSADLFAQKRIGAFRFSAALIEWSQSEFEGTVSKILEEIEQWRENSRTDETLTSLTSIETFLEEINEMNNAILREEEDAATEFPSILKLLIKKIKIAGNNPLTRQWWYDVMTSRPPPLPKNIEKCREEILDRVEEGGGKKWTGQRPCPK